MTDTTEHPANRKTLIQQFSRREDGAITSFGVVMSIAMVVVGGLGLDVANAIMARTQLQVAADAAAHAALVAREYKTVSESKQIAIAVAKMSLPEGHFGNTIQESDIEFGYWDYGKKEFRIDPTSDEGVLVNTQRLAERGNGLATFFLRFAGMQNVNVVSQSVFETYYSTCFREGFVAENVVDVQSNNTYGNGFCIHSNDHVEINNGNSFLDGTVVSMPNTEDMVVPTGGYEANPGLVGAMRPGAYELKILDRIGDIIAGVKDKDSEYFRNDYVTTDPLSGNPILSKTLDSTKGGGVDLADWLPGAIHYLNCNSPKKQVAWGKPDEIFVKGILITNCIIKFGQGVQLQDVIMVNENTDLDSFTAASSFTLGRDDGCLPGGGAQLVTLGGVNFPSDFGSYGGQIVAAKAIKFAARNDSVEGISLVSGDVIDGSSLINVGFCGGAGMDNNFVARYYRLAT